MAFKKTVSMCIIGTAWKHYHEATSYQHLPWLFHPIYIGERSDKLKP